LELLKEKVIVLSPKRRGPCMGRTIEELDLSVRAYNYLRRSNINTLCDLMSMTEDDLIRQLGKKSAAEVLGKLRALGIELRKSRQEC
jgi:DNA-directed RNA polymerase subunit alpha